jgi:hypothetical protein
MMASVVNRPNGRREIQFTDAAGKRQTVRLGKMPKRDAESVKTRIEHLLTAQITKRPLEGDTARWVASLDDVLADRLAKVGLIRQRESAYLAGYIDAYIAGRTDLKPRTQIKFNATKGYLIEFFKGDRNLRDITAGDADDWRVFLLAKGMSENTVRKHTQIAKQFFTAAVRRKLIESNPFAELKSTVQANPRTVLLCYSRCRRQSARRMPRLGMAAYLRSEPLRWVALSVGTPGFDVGLHRLGERPNPNQKPQDGTSRRQGFPHDSHIPRTATAS